jgi:DNA-binding LytR/AlgR family response regulator
MLKIAICDDKPQEAEIAKEYLQLYFKAHLELESDVSVYYSAIELLNHIEGNNSFDILLLDIYMPGILGIEVAQQLYKDKNKCQIVFLTTSRDYAVEAFAVNAVYYLLKPYSFIDFSVVMDKAVEKIEKNAKQYLRITNRRNVYMINLESLLYVESINHSQFVHSITDSPIELRMTMNELFKTISGTDCGFYRVGASYIVNLSRIRTFSNKEIVMSDGKRLPVPRGAFQELKKAHIRVLFKEIGD